MDRKYSESDHFDFEDLKVMCEGHWEEIISALSDVDLSEAVAKLGRHVLCHNNHGGRKKHFRLFKDFHRTGGGICTKCGGFSTGFSLLAFLNGWDNRTAVKEVADYLRQKGERPNKARKLVSVAPPPPVFELDRKKLEDLERTWKEAVPLAGTHGEAYLRERGLRCDLPDPMEVRFHPRLGYFEEETNSFVGYFPAIISLLRSNKGGYPLTIHRIYLDPESGKAKVLQPKKLMSVPIDNAISTLGGAIRLYKVNGPMMGVTEGLETAMAVRSLTPYLTVWATYSSGVLKKFTPPPGVNRVIVYGDVDASGTGQAAAATLVHKLRSEGIDADLFMPQREVCLPPPGRGWYNDSLTPELMAAILEEHDHCKVVDSCRDMDWADYLTMDDVERRCAPGIRRA